MPTETVASLPEKCDRGHALSDLRDPEKQAAILDQITCCAACVAALSQNPEALDELPETVERDILRATLVPYDHPPAPAPAGNRQPLLLTLAWVFLLISVALAAFQVTPALIHRFSAQEPPEKEPIAPTVDHGGLESKDAPVQDSQGEDKRAVERTAEFKPRPVDRIRAIDYLPTAEERAAASKLFNLTPIADGWLHRLDDPEEKMRKFREVFDRITWSDFTIVSTPNEMILRNDSSAPVRYLLTLRHLNFNIPSEEWTAAIETHGPDQAARILDQRYRQRTTEVRIEPGHSVSLTPEESDIVIRSVAILDRE